MSQSTGSKQILRNDERFMTYFENDERFMTYFETNGNNMYYIIVDKVRKRKAIFKVTRKQLTLDGKVTPLEITYLRTEGLGEGDV